MTRMLNKILCDILRLFVRALFISFIIYLLFYTRPPKRIKFEEFACYQSAKNIEIPVELLEDILESEKQPSKGKAIFFIETSCARDGLIHLTPSQGCAIESAALHHPKRDIFLLIGTPVGYPSDKKLLSPIVRALQHYPNIHFRNVNMQKFVNDTPVEKWFHTGELFSSWYIVEHTSDFLRLLTLYRFGGTYFDLDFIILRNLDKLQPNFFGEELPHVSSSGAINFSPDGIGHEMVSIILQEFAQKFNGSEWATNGPHLLRMFAERVCGTKNHTLFTRERCVGFEAHRRPVFYPVQASFYRRIFYQNSSRFILNKIKKSMAIHMWGALFRHDHQIINEAKSAYSILAKKNCPNVHAVGGNIFESV